MTKCPKCGYEETTENSSEIDLSLYYQRSERYSGKKLGNSNTSMQNYGCGLMCFSYVKKMDPIEVNQLFIDKGVYSGDMIVFEKACAALELKNYEKSTDINRMPTQEEIIKEVLLGKSQHFTVRINKDGKRTIFDPWTGKIQSINFYTFRSYRIFDK
jgi:hypothetical protein